LSISVKQMSEAPSHNKPSSTPVEDPKQGTDPAIVNSDRIGNDRQQKDKDEQEAEHELQNSADKNIGAIEVISEDDLDPVCLCASDAVINIILRQREAAMHKLDAALGMVQEDEPQSLSRQYSLSVTGRLLDKHISECLELLETDLAKETANNTRGEQAEHISAEMRIIMEYHIEQALEETNRELQSLTITKIFLEMMIYHEYFASEQSSSVTFVEYIRGLRWSDRSTVGLKKRFEVLLNHMVLSGLSDVPDNTVEYFFRNTSPSNLGGKYSKEGLELPLERWGSLESLLHIRENDRIMSYLVNFILWLTSTYAITEDPTLVTPLLRDIELSAEEQEVLSKIWLGEEQEGITTVEKNMCLVCSKAQTELKADSLVSLSHGESGIGLQPGSSVGWIMKAVRKRPDTSLAGKRDFLEGAEDRIIQVFDKDFYNLYHKYTGEVHPDDHGKHAHDTASSPSEPTMPIPAPRKVYKRHVLLDIEGEDWTDMMQKYGYHPACREQDIQPYRGMEALRFILATEKNGLEWNNEEWFHIPSVERRMAADDGD